MKEEVILIKALRNEVQKRLRLCTPTANPKLYDLLKLPNGMQRAEEMVIRKAMYDRMSIGAAISHIEAEML